MSVTVSYFADPPQYARLGRTYLYSTDTPQVGDKLYYSSGITLYFYRCTTSGTPTPGSSFSPSGGPTTYNWGTSVWTRITALDSWDNAGYAYALASGDVGYIDYMSRAVDLAGTTVCAAYVCVDRNTMLPRHALYSVGHNTGGDSVLFFHYGTESESYHGKTTFGFLATGTDLDKAVDSDYRSVGGYSGMNYSRGIRGAVSSANGIGGRSNSVAITVDNAYQYAATPSITTAAYDSCLGVHFNLNSPGQVFTTSIAYTVHSVKATLFSGNSGYVSENNYSQPFRRSYGMVSDLVTKTNVHRNGQAQDVSLVLSGLAVASPGAMHVSPFFYVQNTLTGTRTVTMHFLTDSPYELDLYDTDIFMDVFYPSSNTTSLYSMATSQNTNFGVPNCAKTQVTSDAATWTYSDIFYPTAFKLSVTMSIQKGGVLMVRFNVASPKLTMHNLYVCPFIEVA
jgi:hypothetical protein